MFDTMRTSRLMAAGLIAGLLLVGGACGNDDGPDEAAATTTTAEADDGTDDLETTTSTSTTSSPTTISTTTTTTTTTTTSSTKTSSTTTTTASDASDALAFFQRTESECISHSNDVGNTPPEPQRFADATVLGSGPGSGDTWLIEDGMGDQLIVDLDGAVVHSTDGPDQPLPAMYSFGCPPDLYPGTMTH